MILTEKRRISIGRVKQPAYTARLSRDPRDVRNAQRLRFEVFNLELNEGLAESHFTGLDADPFDAVCDHLVVEETASGNIVGTYRLQTGERAAANIGYYSEREFDFSRFEQVRRQIVELGRACIHVDHRNDSVLHLLWRGIAQYAVQRNARYLLGCSSLTSQDPVEGAAVYAGLCGKFLVAENLRTEPLEEFKLDCGEVAPGGKVPKLLRAYLAVGARICGPPAIDREFGTIDFLTLLDLQTLPAIVRAHFLK